MIRETAYTTVSNPNTQPKHTLVYSFSETVKTVLTYCLLVLIALFVLIPIVWIVGSSFNPASSLLSATAFPEDPTIKHYLKLFTETKFPYWYLNTLKIALVNMVISVILTSTSAYVFSRFNFKGKKVGLLSILILQMFPSFMGMMAVYNILWQLGLLDTHLGSYLLMPQDKFPIIPGW